MSALAFTAEVNIAVRLEWGCLGTAGWQLSVSFPSWEERTRQLPRQVQPQLETPLA